MIERWRWSSSHQSLPHWSYRIIWERRSLSTPHSFFHFALPSMPTLTLLAPSTLSAATTTTRCRCHRRHRWCNWHVQTENAYRFCLHSSCVQTWIQFQCMDNTLVSFLTQALVRVRTYMRICVNAKCWVWVCSCCHSPRSRWDAAEALRCSMLGWQCHGKNREGSTVSSNGCRVIGLILDRNMKQQHSITGLRRTVRVLLSFFVVRLSR